MTVIDGAARGPHADDGGSVADQHDTGLLGRIGAAAARRFRVTLVVWLAVLAGLGVLAPKAMTSLAGAGWQADGS